MIQDRISCSSIRRIAAAVVICITALLSPHIIHAEENQWFAISLDNNSLRYTPNKTVYETDGVYKNNWVKIDLLTEEARKEENYTSKTWLIQYRSDFHEYRIIAIQFFDANGKILDMAEDPYAEWHHVMPESIIEWLANKARGLWQMQKGE